MKRIPFGVFLVLSCLAMLIFAYLQDELGFWIAALAVCFGFGEWLARRRKKLL
ncbi:MAG: hypothetical protein KBC30_03065 [Planctomycetes bacterium]|mgnify:CR=1 FL=1|jgi:hypothetical protein|nr:hypothetical protein [Planctomycetota bacterium]HNZ66678.1 hypothetical protein [Planctomycetota bacterium]HON44305.1 hypothetical protein [Planctomycetota bacterium]HPY74228.1 hypothetical protein [Planctomycetota bacterium]HQB00057.1 hypothetical protein [Planctomycetota bacterium]